MNALNCIDETFDKNFTSEYKLSIQVGLDGFSFCILDEIRKKFLVFKHFPFLLSNYSFLHRKVKEIIESEEILRNEFRKIVVGFVSTKFTPVPQWAELANEKQILGLSFDISSDEAIGSYQSGLFEGKVIFAYPEKVAGYLKSILKEPAFFHQAKPLFSIFAAKLKPGKPTAFITFGSRSFTLLIFDGENMAFANSFNLENDLDFNFYLLNSFQSLAIGTQDAVVSLAGEIQHSSPQFRFIKSRFKEAEFLKLSKGYQYSYTFSEFPQHTFISVINTEE